MSGALAHPSIPHYILSYEETEGWASPLQPPWSPAPMLSCFQLGAPGGGGAVPAQQAPKQGLSE